MGGQTVMEEQRTGNRGSVMAIVALALLGILVGLTTVSHASFRTVSGQSDSPGFTIGATGRATLYPGQATTYTVRGRWTTDEPGGITLRVAGLPPGVTGTFASRNGQPNSVTPLWSRATLILNAGPEVAPGTNTITFSGTSGGVTRRTTSQLTIAPLPRSNVALSVSPSSAATTASAAATYVISLTRTRFPHRLALCIGSILPVGVTATFTPDPVLANSSTLTLATTSTTLQGTFPFEIRARDAAVCRPPKASRRAGGSASARRFTTGAAASLVVGTPSLEGGGTPAPVGGFTIAGDAAPVLYPGGGPSPIDLTFQNPTSQTIYVTDVTVSVTGTSAGPACTAGAFTTTDFSYGTPGSGGVPVGPGQTVSLQGAGVPPTEWPIVQMVDDGDQDACQGATVYLRYTDGLGYTP